MLRCSGKESGSSEVARSMGCRFRKRFRSKGHLQVLESCLLNPSDAKLALGFLIPTIGISIAMKFENG